MVVWEKKEVDDECFRIFEHSGITWMINKDTCEIYHFDTGFHMRRQKNIQSDRWRTAMKKFKLMLEKTEDEKNTVRTLSMLKKKINGFTVNNEK